MILNKKVEHVSFLKPTFFTARSRRKKKHSRYSYFLPVGTHTYVLPAPNIFSANWMNFCSWFNLYILKEFFYFLLPPFLIFKAEIKKNPPPLPKNSILSIMKFEVWTSFSEEKKLVISHRDILSEIITIRNIHQN